MKKLFAVLLIFCLLLPVLAAAEELATPTDLCDHEWVQKDGKSVCSICGKENPCRVNHDQDYEIIMALYEDSEADYDEEDDCWHYVDGIGYMIKRCPECGMVLEREDNVEVEFPDFHNYDENHTCTVCGRVCTHSAYADGLCVYCGYACPHPALTHAVAFYAFGEYDILYSPINENYHRATGTGNAWDECVACGMAFNMQEAVPLSESEEHFFEGYECAFCHYVKDPADDEIAAAVQDMLTGEAETEIRTDENGRKTVIAMIGAPDKKEDPAILFTATAEALRILTERNVTGVVLKTGNKGFLLDTAAIQKQLEENEGAKLIIELDPDAKPDEKLGETYEIREENLLAIRRIVLMKNDTETEVEEGVQLFLETEETEETEKPGKPESKQILYISKDGIVATADAESVEAAEDFPAHWEIPYAGAGIYVPATPKTAE